MEVALEGVLKLYLSVIFQNASSVHSKAHITFMAL
jgi:hypothetical protein